MRHPREPPGLLYDLGRLMFDLAGLDQCAFETGMIGGAVISARFPPRVTLGFFSHGSLSLQTRSVSRATVNAYAWANGDGRTVARKKQTLTHQLLRGAFGSRTFAGRQRWAVNQLGVILGALPRPAYVVSRPSIEISLLDHLE
jgi:hypothetical protein